MHKKHAGRAADRASAVAATADIVGEEHFTAAANGLIGGRSFMIVQSLDSVSGSRLLCPAVVMK